MFLTHNLTCIRLLAVACLTAMVACGHLEEAAKTEDTLFELLPESQSGIQFTNRLRPTEDLNMITYLYYYNGGGVAAGDINGDGLIDLFFTANQTSDRLYLNKGDMHFEDVTTSAGIDTSGAWSSGASFADIDQDGDLDLHVCRVSGHAGLTGRNQLYINDGTGRFRESAQTFGLDISALSTQAAFYDADNDGDLDMYLLAHSVHETERFTDTSRRKQASALAGDRLYLQTVTGKFEDRSQKKGIRSSRLGYGLGLCIADLVGDARPELYVSNDFAENDYLYEQQASGRYQEFLERRMVHTSKFSMGSVAADIDNDGDLDVMTLDMRPSSDSIRKSSAGEESPRQLQQNRQRGFHDQLARNCVQRNDGGTFTDVAAALGLHSTDWSWSPIIADFDLDGQQDVFVANGIWQRPNDLDYLKYTSSAALQSSASNLELASLMPAGLQVNACFSLDTTGLTYTRVSEQWGFTEADASTGVIAVDLDNDGDLDIVTNRINAAAQIYENKAPADLMLAQRQLRIDLRNANGSIAVGATVTVRHTAGWTQQQAVQPVTGFQSSVIAPLLITLPTPAVEVQLNATWPSGKTLDTMVRPGALVLRETQRDQMPGERASPASPRALLAIRDAELELFIDDPLVPVKLLPEARALAGLTPVTKQAVVLGGGTWSIGKESFPDVQALLRVQTSDATRAGIATYLVSQGDASDSETWSLLAVSIDTSTLSIKRRRLSSNLDLFGSMCQVNETVLLGAGWSRGGLARAPKSLALTAASIPWDENQSLRQLVAWPLGSEESLGEVTGLHSEGQYAYVAALYRSVLRLLPDADSRSTSGDTLTRTGLWTGIEPCGGELVFANVGYNNLLLEHRAQQFELHLGDFDRNGEVDPIAVRREGSTGRTLFGLDQISGQMPPLRKFFTRYLPFSSSTYESMFPPELTEGSRVLRAETLDPVRYDFAAEEIRTIKGEAEQSSCQTDKLRRATGAVRINPLLRGH